MNISNLNTQNPNIYPQYKPNFCANPFKVGRTILEKRIHNSPFDVAEKIYDDLWEELKLPKDLKIPFAQRPYEPGTIMAFEVQNLCIGINKNISKLKMHLMNITGITKALLRHEIEHVQQRWLAIRYEGIDKVINDLPEKQRPIDINAFRKYFQKVEKYFKKIKPEEIEDAIKYVNAIEEHENFDRTSFSMSYTLIEFIKYCIKYYSNDLERDANKAQKEYMPGRIEFIKTVTKELYQLVRNKRSQTN